MKPVFDFLPLYLRKERRQGLPVVAYYRDPGATKAAAVNPWPSRPTRRNRFVMLNCFRFRAVWLPDL